MTDLILAKKYLTHTYRIFTDRIEMIRKGKIAKILYFSPTTAFTYNIKYSFGDFISVIYYRKSAYSGEYSKEAFMISNGSVKDTIIIPININEYRILEEKLPCEIELV